MVGLPHTNFRATLQRILQRLKSFVLSKDALMYLFFILLATGIWYIRALHELKDSVTPSSQTKQTEESVNYTDKQLVLPIKYRGEPRDSELVLFPSEVTITARIDLEHYQDISYDDFSAVCTYSQKVSTQLPIEVSCSSPYVSSFRYEPKTAEYIIQKKH